MTFVNPFFEQFFPKDPQKDAQLFDIETRLINLEKLATELLIKIGTQAQQTCEIVQRIESIVNNLEEKIDEIRRNV
jgi:hypothetical protein